jgi:GTP cyclohydrolase II
VQRDLIGDPLFQLNVMVLLSWRGTRRAGITPLFAEAGYELSFIERTIPVPEPARLRLTESGIEVQMAASPDVFLEHPDARAFVPIECKRSSFSAASSTARQARAMLLLEGSVLASFIGKPPGGTWSGVLTYLSVEGNGTPLLATLRQLSEELRGNGARVSESASLEISWGSEGVYVTAVAESAPLPSVELIRPVLALRLRPGEDPRPLYPIPVLPGGGQERDIAGEAQIRELLRIRSLALLGSLGPRREYDLDEDFLARAVQVWTLWRNEQAKRNLRVHARAYLRDLFGDIASRIGVACEVRGHRIIIPEMSAQQARDLRSYLQGAENRRRPISLSGAVQGSFDEFVESDGGDDR